MSQHSETQIPSVAVVRFVSGVLLILSLALVAAGILQIEILGVLVATGAIITGIASTGMSIMGLITGNPEWVLLSLLPFW